MYKIARELAIRRIFIERYADEIIEGKRVPDDMEAQCIDEVTRAILFEEFRPRLED